VVVGLDGAVDLRATSVADLSTARCDGRLVDRSDNGGAHVCGAVEVRDQVNVEVDLNQSRSPWGSLPCVN
jgi:hypothetical protein